MTRASKSAIQEELDEFKSQCEIGLQVQHDCPAVFALAYILGQIDRVKTMVGKLEKKAS